MNRVVSISNISLYLVVVLDENIRAADPTIYPLVSSLSARCVILRMLAFAKMFADEAIHGGSDGFIENLCEVVKQCHRQEIVVKPTLHRASSFDLRSATVEASASSPSAARSSSSFRNSLSYSSWLS